MRSLTTTYRVAAGSVVAVICAAFTMAAAQSRFVPAARYRNGDLPQIPLLAVGGGEVLLELAVASTGNVTEVRPLQTTSLYTEVMTDVVPRWQFVPAEEQGKPVASKVLVAGLFRPPSINTATLGEVPADVGAPSPDVAFPLLTVMPAYPPLALDSGVVLIEAQVDPAGEVTDAQVVRSAPPFDPLALESALQWKFRPARVRGAAAATYAYIVFAFRQPVTNAPGR